jgi:hypothetical protein
MNNQGQTSRWQGANRDPLSIHSDTAASAFRRRAQLFGQHESRTPGAGNIVPLRLAGQYSEDGQIYGLLAAPESVA